MTKARRNGQDLLGVQPDQAPQIGQCLPAALVVDQVGHFNGPLESLLWDKNPVASPQRSLGKVARSR